ncbi:hypothetical protein [Streptomyces sp. P9-1]|uniref:hypothetical protein n=1 Tax=Streptomyces sp. P9-1 TaxID=3422589 RepID=UPI003D3636E7
MTQPETARLHDEILTGKAEIAKLRDLLTKENKRANDAIAREDTAEQAAEEAHAELRHARAALARIHQMTDYWEQNLPEVIRTPAVVSALRAAMERAEPAAVSAAVAPPTDRAAVLREAADRIDNEELPHDYVDMFDNGARWAARLLRRMADETATEHRPAVSRWRVETLDNLANEWAPGTGWPVRALAVERFELMNAQAPRWKDGTPVTRRLVRETTTYTVEAETGPAAGARQDGAES